MKINQITDLEKISKIGEGAFGEVYLVKNKKDGAQFALKQISKK